MAREIMELPATPFLIAIVEPLDSTGRKKEPIVQVYERLDSNPRDPIPGGVQHVKYIDWFPLYDISKNRNLTLNELAEKVRDTYKRLR